MTITLTRTADGYIYDRFAVTRVNRRALRGPNDLVADGWCVADTLTGARQRAFSLADARGVIERALNGDAAARRFVDQTVGWRIEPNRQGPAAHVAVAEVYLALDPASDVRATSFAVVGGVRYPLVRAGLVGGPSEELVGRVENLLGLIGVSGVPQITG